MPRLFQGHILRSTIAAGLAVAAGHQFLHRLPDNFYAFTMAQTSIAIIALSAIMLITVAHHHRRGQAMTQTQEEMLLIGAFGLFWLAVLVALRAFGQRDDPTALDHGLMPARTAAGDAYRRTVRSRPEASSSWACGGDAYRCVVEEWGYY